MFKRVSLAVFLVASMAATTASAATPPKPPTGPTITISPVTGKPGASLTIVGKMFAPKQVTPVELDCPMYGHTKHGQWKWTPRTGAHGTFRIAAVIPRPLKARTAICHVYALYSAAKRSFYVSTQFNIQ